MRRFFFLAAALLTLAFPLLSQDAIPGTVFMTVRDRQNITNLQSRMGDIEGSVLSWDGKLDADGGSATNLIVSGTLTLNNTNVQEIINTLWDEVYYVTPTVAWVSPLSGYRERGSAVTSVNLSFTVNKPMESRVYSGGHSLDLGAGSGHALTLPVNITSDTTFTIKVTDVRNAQASASQSALFRNRRYMGKSAVYPMTNAQILNLGTGWEAKGGSGSISLSEEYIYIAYPARLGACTVFSLGGFATSPWPSETVEVTNSSGFGEGFLIYRSANKLSGIMSYEVR